MTKRVVAVLAVIWTAAGADFAAQQTWTGVISDSLCSASHARMAQSVFPPLDDPACVLACVDGGGKFVFMDGEKPLQIANQDFAELKKHAGVRVTVTGELKFDEKAQSSYTGPLSLTEMTPDDDALTTYQSTSPSTPTVPETCAGTAGIPVALAGWSLPSAGLTGKSVVHLPPRAPYASA